MDYIINLTTFPMGKREKGKRRRGGEGGGGGCGRGGGGDAFFTEIPPRMDPFEELVDGKT